MILKNKLNLKLQELHYTRAYVIIIMVVLISETVS